MIGVSADITNWNSSDRPLPTAYLDARSIDALALFFFARASDPRQAVSAESITRAIETLDYPIERIVITPMDEVARTAFWRQEMLSLMWSMFGIAALLLTAAGIYGVLAYLVSLRAREIGIRMALGADRGSVLRMVLLQGAGFVGVGVAIGVVGAYLVASAMRGLLYGVQPLDLTLFFGVTALAAVGRIGCDTNVRPRINRPARATF